MSREIDGLKEVCETVQIVRTEENNIAVIEKQIADKMRATTAKIFDGSTKYRMKKVVIDGLPYWAFSVMLKDNINFNGNFYGSAILMRVSMTGRIQTITQIISGMSRYNLNHGNDWSSESGYDPKNEMNRVSSDHEIATHAQKLAGELLEALKTRIDTMKTEKATLQKMAHAIL